MKRLGKKIIWFLFPVLLVWAGLEIFYRTVETNYTKKHELIQQNYNTAQILILGSSHSYYGLNPEYFSKKTYNFSNISQSLYFDELLLKKHLDSLQNLKAVVLTIGYFTLSQEDDGLEDRWRKYFYDQQMDLDVPSVSILDPKKYSLALSRKFSRSVDLVKEYCEEGTIISHSPNGYGIQDSSDILANKEEIAHIIARKHENGSLDFESNRERIERIIAMCQANGVQVFFVQMPAHPAYVEALDLNKWKKIDELLEEVSHTSNLVHHIDLTRHPAFTVDDLRDADHLTNDGATKCSKLLSDYIDSKLEDR
ncbi:MAG: hypothetical protein DWP94_06935 [Flavobacterium sp.]|nr:MAG: hypothetical protein DWP94_06935 [Flavobacterium sp.]